MINELWTERVIPLYVSAVKDRRFYFARAAETLHTSGRAVREPDAARPLPAQQQLGAAGCSCRRAEEEEEDEVTSAADTGVTRQVSAR